VASKRWNTVEPQRPVPTMMTGFVIFVLWLTPHPSFAVRACSARSMPRSGNQFAHRRLSPLDGRRGTGQSTET
jgi:hypothetical protein